MMGQFKTWWTLKILQVKKVSHKTPYSIWFHSYKVRIGKSTEKKSRFVFLGLRWQQGRGYLQFIEIQNNQNGKFLHVLGALFLYISIWPIKLDWLVSNYVTLSKSLNCLSFSLICDRKYVLVGSQALSLLKCSDSSILWV